MWLKNEISDYPHYAVYFTTIKNEFSDYVHYADVTCSENPGKDT